VDSAFTRIEVRVQTPVGNQPGNGVPVRAVPDKISTDKAPAVRLHSERKNEAAHTGFETVVQSAIGVKPNNIETVCSIYRGVDAACDQNFSFRLQRDG